MSRQSIGAMADKLPSWLVNLCDPDLERWKNETDGRYCFVDLFQLLFGLRKFVFTV